MSEEVNVKLVIPGILFVIMVALYIASIIYSFKRGFT